MIAGWEWQGEPARETICLFYPHEETSPRAGEGAWNRPVAALRAAAANPVKVDAVITTSSRTRLAGTIAGRDFDFTIAADGKTSRQIAVGEKSWVSADGGKTWQEEKVTDRAYFDKVRFPLDAVADVALFRPVDRTFAGSNSGGATEWWFSTAPGYDLEGNPDLAAYRVAVKDGRALALRSFDGEFKGPDGKLAGVVHAEYSAAQSSLKVLPPPGGPAPVLAERPEEMLADAVKAMEGRMWHVRRSWQLLDRAGNGAWDRAPYVVGLASGGDFDETITLPAAKGEGVLTTRRTGVGGNAWRSTDGGATWKEDPVCLPSTVLPARLLGGGPALPLYDAVGTERHGSETWLRIRLAPGVGIAEANWHFWLLLDKTGRAVLVRRCAWPNSDSREPYLQGKPGEMTYSVEDFTPAKEGDKIEPPEVK